MNTPLISIIIPVYNGQSQLPQTVSRIREQTLEDFEVIFVDDGSTDASAELLEQICRPDPRFRFLRQAHRGAGAARNRGLREAAGTYVLFSDCDDLYTPNMLQTLYRTALEACADITACNYTGLDERGKAHHQTGIVIGLLPPDTHVFNWETVPDNILRVMGSVVWNKLYRRAFLEEAEIRFDELLTCNDLGFVAVSLARSRRIAYSPEHLVQYRFPRLNNPKNWKDLMAAVSGVHRQLKSLTHYETIRNGVFKYVAEQYVNGLKKYIRNFTDPEAEAFYRSVHQAFNEEDFAWLVPEQISNPEIYNTFATVRKHSYDAMAKLQSKRLIVSVTTYPRRIGVVGNALQSIYAQTKKPDEVILWLAQEQFPGKEGDLPEDLLRLVEENRLTVRWCADLKSHKKYFYAFQEYPDDLVVTIDDDLEYAPNMLAQLYASYLLYPEAVSTVRTHLMVLSRDDTFLPYDRWGHEQDSLVHIPSMQLMATSGAGTLHPPGLFRKEFFDWQAIQDNCLYADDLWLKAMELFSDVPVVQVGPGDKLRILPGTQEDSLYELNFRQGYNDVQLNNIIRWTDTVFGPHTFLHKLKNPVWGEGFLDMEAFAWHTEQRRRSLHGRLRSAQRELNAARKESKDTTAALQLQKKQAEEQQAADRSKLHTTEEKLKQTEEQLRKTKEKLKQVEESKPIGRQLRALKPGKQQPMSLKLLMKRAVYCLAWVPEKALALMMRILRN